MANFLLKGECCDDFLWYHLKATINSFLMDTINGGLLNFKIGLIAIKDLWDDFTSAQNTYYWNLIWRKMVIAPSILVLVPSYHTWVESWRTFLFTGTKYVLMWLILRELDFFQHPGTKVSLFWWKPS